MEFIHSIKFKCKVKLVFLLLKINTMKKIKFTSVLILTALFAAAQNGAYFEYKITSAKGINGTSATKYSEYGTMSTMNMSSPKMPNGGMTMTTLTKKDTPDMFYMLNDKSKTYSEMKKGASGNHEDNSTYTVKKIGNETINGYKCVHATVTNEKGSSEDIWSTKDIPDYGKYQEALNNNKQMSSSKRQQALKDAGCEGFPVKMTKKGKEDEDMTMELQKIEKKSFSKSDFEIPAGYTKSAGAGAPTGIPGVKTQEEIMKMTPEERAKYIEELKKQYGK